MHREGNNEDDLNTDQLAAASHIEGPLLVLAGAGTGKTRVIISRIINIIKSGVAPWNILAVTFTNKAAKEMRQRLDSACGYDARVNFGTFHSTAARILRSSIEILDIGVNSRFSIIDQSEQIKLVKDLLTKCNIDTTNYPPKYIHEIISSWKDKALLPEQVSEGAAANHTRQIALKIYKLYQSEMAASNVLDFADLLLYNILLFKKSGDTLKKYQDIFRYILVDEYQDSNYIQHLWVKMLAGDRQNICCVGDDDQSIYSWRGAEIANILSFKNDFPSAKLITLERNYRSSAHILAAASGLISYNTDRHPKTLWTDRDALGKVNIVRCPNDKAEAAFVSQRAARMIAQGMRPTSIAILVRASFQTRIFEEFFISSSLPYQIIGGIKFYDRAEVKDMIAYIRLAVNNDDNLALLRIINVPRRGVGKKAIEKIQTTAQQRGSSLFSATRLMIEEGAFSKNISSNLNKLCLQVDSWHKKFESGKKAKDVCSDIMHESGYLDYLQSDKSKDNSSKIENLNEMLSAISEFEDIHQFLEHASLVSNNDALEEDLGGSVNIMTLHAAKGLEFDCVFLPGWEEGILPHEKSISSPDSDSHLQEERRIAYVGITRAKREIFISHAMMRLIYGALQYKEPSRFLAELPADVCSKHSARYE